MKIIWETLNKGTVRGTLGPWGVIYLRSKGDCSIEWNNKMLHGWISGDENMTSIKRYATKQLRFHLKEMIQHHLTSANNLFTILGA